MGSFFLAIYRFFSAKKGLLYFVFIATVTLLTFFASKIQLQENFMQMLPKDKHTEQFTNFYENSKFADRIMVCVSAKDSSQKLNMDSAIVFSDELVNKINRNLNEYIASVEHVASDSNVSEMLSVIDNNLPLFLEDEDYKKIDSIISPEGLEKKIDYNYQTLTGPTGIALKKFILQDPLGLNFIAYNKLKSFQNDENMELYEQHFITKDQKNLLLFINLKYPSSKTDKNTLFFEKLDALIAYENNPYAVVYFGASAVAAGNAKQIRNDTYLTVTITVVLLLGIVFFAFKKISYPLLMLIPVVFGALFALAFFALFKGSISVIALAAGSLILGIAVNYSLHFLTHYSYHPNVAQTIKDLSFPMTIGSLTTIAGFFCLQFVQAPVLRDLGLFAALSLIGAAVATLIFLPHFISVKLPKSRFENNENSRYHKFLEALQSNKYLVAMFVLFTPVFFYFATDTEFESDMNKINYLSPKLQEAEKKINHISSLYQKSVFVISQGKNYEQALQQNENILPVLNKLKKEGKIKSYASVSSLWLSQKEQQKRINKWNEYWNYEKEKEVYQKLIIHGQKVHFNQAAFQPFLTQTQKEFTFISSQDIQLLKNIFLNNFIYEKAGSVSLVNIIKSTEKNAKEVYAALEKKDNVSVFDRQYITHQLVETVSDDFGYITLFTSSLVLIALLLSYGRIELALMAFIPMAVAWIWILGIMALLGIKFNIINIVLSTLVFALGDDYCLFTMDGLQQKYARGAKNLQSVSTSILLSVGTTIVGLGTLIFAKHPALNSIGLVSIVGITCVWLVSQTLQPVLFNFFISRPTQKKFFPLTFWSTCKSLFAFTYFVLGALLLALFGFVVLRAIPFKNKKMKYLYHWVLAKFSKSMIYIMPNVKKKIINESQENFSKPAMVIANHLSVLDILLMVMLNPKLILFTNNWVCNSPIFGAVVRRADYVLAGKTEEATLEKLRERVKEGYSIVVFPEGTRSVDGKIGRFHKGAFFAAEKLHIDILPVVLHGTDYCMTKGNLFLKDGQITLKYLPRITPDNTQYGTSYSQRAKEIGKYFRQEYAALCTQIETPAYYKNKVMVNYLFKGPVLEWYMRIKIKLENNYQLFHDIISKEGKILDMGCGYGFMSNMLAYLSPKREITGVDYDGDKIEIAQHGFLKSNKVVFQQGDALTFNYQNFNTIVFMDVLHYLQHHQQVQVLENCFSVLPENGQIIIRDGVVELKDRHKGTKLTELFSTRIFGFNKTQETGLSFLSAKLIHDAAEKFNFTVQTIDNTKFTSNVIFLLKRKT